MLRISKEVIRWCRLKLGYPVSHKILKGFEDGHFYSPIVNTEELERDATLVWPDCATAPGVDFNEPEQRRWLMEILPKHLPHFDYPNEQTAASESYAFFCENPAFSWLDSKALFAVLREYRPRKMIEIGSGFSSLLAADVNRRFLDGQLELTCIEPYPPDFLRQKVPGISRVIESRVQDVPIDTFDTLEAGDVLFIDSSHVSKTGSDVNHIYLQILPRIQPGVLIHIHDIFLPNDYPQHWLLGLGLNWNEQYLVQTFLAYSRGFEVLFGSAYVLERLPALLTDALNGELYGGSSLWLRKTLCTVEKNHPSP